MSLFGIGEMLGQAMSSAINSGSNAAIQDKINQTNLQIARENNQANKELSELAYQQNLAQWNAENAYNTPLAQMQRYKDAGLNPNLIYGQSNTSARSPQLSYSPSTMPQVQGSRVDISFPDILSFYTQFKSWQQDMKLKDLQGENFQNQNDYTKEMINKQRIDNLTLEARNDALLNNLRKQGLLSDEQIENLKVQRKNLEQDTQLKKGQKTIQDFEIQNYSKYGLPSSALPSFMKPLEFGGNFFKWLWDSITSYNRENNFYNFK